MRLQAPLQAGRSAGSEMMIVCQTAAEELETLTLSVLLLYSTQEFIRAEQREDDRPITQTTHRHCGSLVSLCHSVYYCVHLYLWFIKSLKQEAKTSETLKTCSYFPPVLSLYQLYQMHTHSICIRPFFKL